MPRSGISSPPHQKTAPGSLFCFGDSPPPAAPRYPHPKPLSSGEGLAAEAACPLARPRAVAALFGPSVLPGLTLRPSRPDPESPRRQSAFPVIRKCVILSCLQKSIVAICND